MAFCLGTLLKTVKKHEIDQSKSDDGFIEEVLGCVLVASGCRHVHFDNPTVSKILSCKRNAPKALKTSLKSEDFQDNLAKTIALYVEKNLPISCFGALSSEILELCNKSSENQVRIFNKLYSTKSNTDTSDETLNDELPQLSNFLAVALIEAIQVSNIIETDRVVYSHGNSVLCLHSGDIFKFCFNRKSKSKNIVVIPVNTRFDTHVSRKFEGSVKQVVSDKTLHGMWLERMLQRSNTKEKVDNGWDEITEDNLRQRILKDFSVIHPKTTPA